MHNYSSTITSFQQLSLTSWMQNNDYISPSLGVMDYMTGKTLSSGVYSLASSQLHDLSLIVTGTTRLGPPHLKPVEQLPSAGPQRRHSLPPRPCHQRSTSLCAQYARGHKVRAVISPETAIPSHLHYIRRNGINSAHDLRFALSYIDHLHPAFKQITDTVRQRHQSGHLKIRIDPKLKNLSYAESSFQQRVDRTTEMYGNKIVLERGASVSTFFHEILHTLPLSIVEPVLKAAGFEHPFVFPEVNPEHRFAGLRNSILEHMRLNEALSFGIGTISHELEREKGVTPVFQSAMDRNLDNAWKTASWKGIYNTFPQYLPHYEDREGVNATLLALVVKTEGRTTLTFDEAETLLKIQDGKLSPTDFFQFLQNYINRYVESHSLEVHPDSYSLNNVARRMDVASSWIEGTAPTSINVWVLLKITSALDSIFASLETWGKTDLPQISRQTKGNKDLQPHEVPPVETHEDRQSLFASYSRVVDSILTDPPPDLSREEMAAMISYTRMLPPELAKEFGELNRIVSANSTKGTKDLRVIQGLILYDKGFEDTGQALITQNITTKIFKKLISTIQKTLSPEHFMNLLTNQNRIAAEGQARLATYFQTEASGQFDWDFVEEGWQETMTTMAAHPDLFDSGTWHEIGLWFYDNIDEIDVFVAQDEGICSFEFSELSSIRTEQRLILKALSELRAQTDLDPRVRELADKMWVSHQEKASAALRASFAWAEKAGDPLLLRHLVSSIPTIRLLFTNEEISELRQNLPPDFQTAYRGPKWPLMTVESGQ